MKVTITSIQLKSPFKFFSLSFYAMKIVKQLRSVQCLEMKKRGFYIKHYTMTLWENEEDLKNFAYSGAHKEALKHGKELAKEIRILTIDSEVLPSWSTAKDLLEQKGQIIKY